MPNPHPESSTADTKRDQGPSLSFETLLNATPGFVLVAEPGGRVVYFNRAVALAAGRPQTTADAGSQLRDLLPPDVAIRLLNSDGGNARGAIKAAADKPEVIAEWSARKVETPSGEQILITGHDVTRETELEEYLASNQWYETMGALSGGLAHDFNNILAAILGLSEIIGLRLPKEDPLQPFAQKIGESVERAKGLVSRFSQSSRKPALMCEPQPTEMVLVELSHLIRGFLTGSVSLDTQIAEDTPWCETDRHVLEQILLNCANFFRTKLRDVGGQCVLSARRSRNGRHALIELRGAGEGLLGLRIEPLFELVLKSAGTAYDSGSGLFAARHLATQTHSVLYARRDDPRTISFVLEVPAEK